MVAGAHAGMILGTPGGPPDTGFFDEHNGTLLGGVSSLQLPEQFGVAGIRVYGSASASGDPAYLRMMAIGGVNAVAGIDTVLRVDYSFQTSPGSVSFMVEGLVGTSAGGYYGSASGIAPATGLVDGSFFLEWNGSKTIPAGATIEAWYLGVYVGGVAGGPQNLTLTTSFVDLVADGQTPSASTPEPSTLLLALSGTVLLIWKRKPRPGGSPPPHHVSSS